MNQGFIKLHRELLEHPVWTCTSSKQKTVLIVILLDVNHAPASWFYNGKYHTINAGQSITSLESIAKQCGKEVSIRMVRTALDKFEKMGFLTSKPTSTGRIITICNWEKYQLTNSTADKQTDKQLTEDRQATGNPASPNKNIKNKNNNRRKETKPFVPPTLEIVSSFISSNKLSVKAEEFVNYYTSIGWKIGKNEMKDWQACIRNWNAKGTKSLKATSPGQYLTLNNENSRKCEW